MFEQLKENLEQIISGLKENFPQSVKNRDWVIYLESFCSAMELFSILNSENSSLDTLQSFLEKRWERIRQTNIAYTQNSELPMNRLCLALADFISQRNGDVKTKYQVLMPTLTSTTDIISGGVCEDSPLTFFVLTEDDNFLMGVKPTLEFFENNGYLGIRDPQNPTRIKRLTTEEQCRVRNHSPLCTAYSVAIDVKFGNGLLKALTELKDGLLGGSILEFKRKGGGSEYNAGKNANEAITRFKIFFDTLSLEQQAFLGNLRAEGWTLDVYLDRLFNPLKYTDAVYCVEIIGNSIEGIIEKNKSMLLGEQEKPLSAARLACFDEIDNPDFNIKNENYGRRGDIKLLSSTFPYLKEQWSVVKCSFPQKISQQISSSIFCSFVFILQNMREARVVVQGKINSLDDWFSFFITQNMIDLREEIQSGSRGMINLNPKIYLSVFMFPRSIPSFLRFFGAVYHISSLRLAFDKKMPRTLFAIYDRQSELTEEDQRFLKVHSHEIDTILGENGQSIYTGGSPFSYQGVLPVESGRSEQAWP